MANTGYRIYPGLKKVSNDVNEYPLDASNHRVVEGGPVQDTMAMPTDDSRYRVLSDQCNVYIFTKSADFQRTCSAGNVGTTVTYSEDYQSDISLDDAVTIASADSTGFNTRGQTFAASTASCIAELDISNGGFVMIDLLNDPTLDVFGYIDSSGTIPHQQPVYRGKNFLPNIYTNVKLDWALASDVITTASLKYRFLFNLGRLLINYPAKASFDFVVFGRAASPGVLSGSAVLKNIRPGFMIMTGTGGTYIPSTDSTTDITTLGYSGKSYLGGGDGSIGFSYGAEILRVRYTVSTKTITIV